MRTFFIREQIARDEVINANTDSAAIFIGVICIVTTGRFSRDALSYVDSVTSETNLSIITIDREDLQMLATSPETVVDILEKKARRTMKLRKAIVS